jgi:hypothetical protein
LRRGKVDLGAAGTSEFFELLLALTMAGYLSDRPTAATAPCTPAR